MISHPQTADTVEEQERCNVFLEGKTWHCRFRIAGVRTQRTTRQTDRAAALVVANRLYQQALARAGFGQPQTTLSELVEEWLGVRGPVSSNSYVRCVKNFDRQTYGLGDLPVWELTTDRVERARNKHLEGHSPATANHWLRILNVLGNWAIKRNILRSLPWDVSMLRVQQRPRIVLPVDMAKAWFGALEDAASNSPGIITAVQMMFALGLRESEAASARWEWVDWERRTYTPGITKGRESVAIPMPNWLVEALAPHRMSAGLISVGRYGKPLRSGFARRPMAVANKACGIDGITPHRLRATFATMLSEHGTPIQTIQHVMRHKDFKTTMSYLAPAITTAVTAQERISQLIGFR